MKRVDLIKKGNQWVQESGRKAVPRGPLKSEAVKKAAQAAKRDPKPVTLKIHKENGHIQEERTYPRSADPRKSKG